MVNNVEFIYVSLYGYYKKYEVIRPTKAGWKVKHNGGTKQIIQSKLMAGTSAPLYRTVLVSERESYAMHLAKMQMVEQMRSLDKEIAKMNIGGTSYYGSCPGMPREVSASYVEGVEAMLYMMKRDMAVAGSNDELLKMCEERVRTAKASHESWLDTPTTDHINSCLLPLSS